MFLKYTLPRFRLKKEFVALVKISNGSGHIH